VRIPLGGAISVTGANGARIEAAVSGEKKSDSYRTLTVKIRPAKEDRTVIVSWNDTGRRRRRRCACCIRGAPLRTRGGQTPIISISNATKSVASSWRLPKAGSTGSKPSAC